MRRLTAAGEPFSVEHDKPNIPGLPQELWLYTISYMPFVTLIRLAQTNKNLAQWVANILQHPFELLSFRFWTFTPTNAYHAWKQLWQQEYPKQLPSAMQSLALTPQQIAAKKELFTFLFDLSPETIEDISASRILFQKLQIYADLLHPFKATNITLFYLKRQTRYIAQTLWPSWNTLAVKFDAFHHTKHLHDLNQFTNETCTVLYEYFQYCAKQHTAEAKQTTPTQATATAPVFESTALIQYRKNFEASLDHKHMSSSELLTFVHGKAAGIGMLAASMTIASAAAIAVLLFGAVVVITIFVAFAQPSLFISTPFLELPYTIFKFLANGAGMGALAPGIGIASCWEWVLGAIATIALAIFTFTRAWNTVTQWFFDRYATAAEDAFIEFITELNPNATSTTASVDEQTGSPVDAVTHTSNQDFRQNLEKHADDITGIDEHDSAKQLSETHTSNHPPLNLFPRQPAEGPVGNSNAVVTTSAPVDSTTELDALDLDLDDPAAENITPSTQYPGAGAF